MTESEFTIARIEPLLARGPARALELASELLGRPAEDADRRRVNTLLLDHPDAFELDAEGRWAMKLDTRPASPVTSAASPPTQSTGATQPPGSTEVGEPVAVRRALLDALRLDLVGPALRDETIPERPTVQYILGVLYPGGSSLPEDASDDADQSSDVPPITDSGENGRSDDEVELDEATVDDGAQPDDDMSDDAPLPSTEALNQSSIGLSFAVLPDVERISCHVSFGTYAQEDSGWTRTDHQSSVDLDLSQAYATYPVDANGELVVQVREFGGSRAVSVFLVNRHPLAAERPDDTVCLFQPELRIESLGGTRSIIHRAAGRGGSDPDLESNRLLYRLSPEFAAGHGCAVGWNPGAVTNTDAVWTDLLPAVEVPSVTPDISGLAKPQMLALSNATQTELRALLEPLINLYDQWLANQMQLASELPDDLEATALAHLDACREASGRIRAGVDLLARNTAARRAFQLSNAAMRLQRLHAQQAEHFRKTGVRRALTSFGEPTWHPFQVAFILLNLLGVADKASPDRRLVDLLWFPTGGGKTEAYLGLAAFTILLRRISGDERGEVREGGPGVTVLMRYTLRLLTVQQFQRAATLACALEELRRHDPVALGSDAISVGLWVGQKTSPNRYDVAKARLTELARGATIADSNPLHLTSCPWCGTALRVADYAAIDATQRVLVHCPNRDCDFHGAAHDERSAIPVVFVDDEIYARLPSLLIGTVDKFARLPWNPATMAIFGRVDRHCPRHGFLWKGQQHPATHRAAGGLPRQGVEEIAELEPPELIIQDELHLITGPLGTLTGLYEAAISFLATRHDAEGRSRIPKVIASTATIRRADDQVRALFARQTRRFPPPALDAAKSFFASQVPVAEAPGRLYLGVYAPGRSGKYTLVRVYARLLESAQELAGRVPTTDPDVLDPYWTLVGYFNSLRELGGAARLIDDDIPGRIGLLSNRSGAAERSVTRAEELTSRVGPERVPQLLEQLERPRRSGQALDTLVATNMIQVGVDVGRLGLMVVAGQPKTSAEYIQATSRIGRASPGLVVTVLNWTRPRDISHYERFRSFHTTLYRHVEGASLTPFSPRSRDRALAGVYVSMVRLSRDGWARNQEARLYRHDDALCTEVLDYLRERAQMLDTAEAGPTEDDVKALADVWQRLAADHPLTYVRAWRRDHPGTALLTRAEDRAPNGEGFVVLNSLRDVEAEAQLRLVPRARP